jgi:hypothetical protein
VLAGAVFLVAAMTFGYLPQPYSAWPAVGSFPVSPELVVPALLGAVVVVDALVRQLSVASVALAALGGVTFLLGAASLYALYTAESGGVFFGGLFTIVAGLVLAAGVLVDAVAQTARDRAAGEAAEPSR